MSRVAGLVRVSTDQQAKHGGSLDDQKSRIIEWCERNGHHVAIWYGEEDRSGGSLATSPGFTQMVEDAAHDVWDMVVCQSMDRFRRKLTDGANALESLKAHGKGVFSLDLGMDVNADDAASEMAAMMQLMVAQQELRRFRDRGKKAKRTSIERGRIVGPPPTGYRYAPKGTRPQIQKDLEQEPLVSFVWKLLLDGATTNEVSRATREAGFVSATGKVGVPQATVNQLAHSPVYAGHYYLYEDRKRVPGLGQEMDWEPYVTPEEWQQVQDSLRLRKNSVTSRGGRPSEHFLLGGGHAFCGECGSTLYSRKDKYSDYYWCPSRKTGITCNTPNIPREVLDGMLRTYLSGSEMLDIESAVATAQETVESQRAALHQQLAQQRRDIERIERRMDTAVLSDDDVDRDIYERLMRQRATTTNNVKQTEKALEALTPELSLTSDATAFIGGLRSKFESGQGFDIPSFRASLRQVFRSVSVCVQPLQQKVTTRGLPRLDGVKFDHRPDVWGVVPIPHPGSHDADEGYSMLSIRFDLNDAFLDTFEFGYSLFKVRPPDATADTVREPLTT